MTDVTPNRILQYLKITVLADDDTLFVVSENGTKNILARPLLDQLVAAVIAARPVPVP